MAKKKRNGLALYNAARKAAKRKRSTPRRKATKRRKASKPKRRKATTMAKRGKRRASPRRASSRRSGGAMALVQPILLTAGGIFAGRMASKMIPIDDPLMRGGAVTAAAVMLAPMLGPAMLPAMIGFGASGVYTMAQQMLPGITGMADDNAPLQRAEIDALEQALLEAGNGIGVDENYEQNLNGEADVYEDENGNIVDGDGNVITGYDERGAALV